MRSLKNKAETIFRSKILVALYLIHIIAFLLVSHMFFLGFYEYILSDPTNIPQKVSTSCSSVYGEEHFYPVIVSSSDYDSEVT